MNKHNTTKNFIIVIFFLIFNINSQDLEIITENNKANQNFPVIKTPKKAISVMIDPAGDAQNTGRIVDDGFERNLTLQVAQEIKNYFEYDKSIRIILSRVALESLEPLQNISFANRLNVDFYLNINICQNNPDDKVFRNFDGNKIFIYYHILNPISDKWPKKFDDLSLIKIDDIYLKNVSKNIDIANSFSKSLKNFSKKISVMSPIGVPLKELIGLKSPALSCEIIVSSKSDIKDFIEPICQALKQITEQIS